MALFEPGRHERLTDRAWDAGAARAAIAHIAHEAHAAYLGPEGLWPIHPLDVSPERPDPMKVIYYGAGGVIWALRRLAAAGLAEPGPDYGPAVRGLVAGHESDLAVYGRPMRSLLTGDAGLRLLEYDMAPSAAVADALAEAVEATIGDPIITHSYGGPGGMAAARFMWERTGEARWADLARRHVDDLRARWAHDEAAGCWLWTQTLHGPPAKWLGALHGFAGVASVLLAARDMLPDEVRVELEARIAQALAATAHRDGPYANWRLTADGHPADVSWRLQHCTGAPGMINGLAGLPADPETDALLLAGGRLIWDAGPIAKLPGLCHGTPGSGYAFLKLARRTGDEVWLERARAFAMHAIGQADRALVQHGRRKWSLWTGDLGLAVYLADCLSGDADFPTLDVF